MIKKIITILSNYNNYFNSCLCTQMFWTLLVTISWQLLLMSFSFSHELASVLCYVCAPGKLHTAITNIHAVKVRWIYTLREEFQCTLNTQRALLSHYLFHPCAFCPCDVTIHCDEQMCLQNSHEYLTVADAFTALLSHCDMFILVLKGMHLYALKPYM